MWGGGGVDLTPHFFNNCWRKLSPIFVWSLGRKGELDPVDFSPNSGNCWVHDQMLHFSYNYKGSFPQFRSFCSGVCNTFKKHNILLTKSDITEPFPFELDYHPKSENKFLSSSFAECPNQREGRTEKFGAGVVYNRWSTTPQVWKQQ